ncbi:hypothetical protein IV203_017873 [Nitzschia inconspicua]|uniref:Uncharacterized protein n=1 Tax=Nitzschia inconspicua TaxID=303405 RepID=A0A9K3M433_9STRA|nr:hypothetical protein IV203_017873 [Nitzschia inconspicua]
MDLERTIHTRNTPDDRSKESFVNRLMAKSQRNVIQGIEPSIPIGCSTDSAKGLSMPSISRVDGLTSFERTHVSLTPTTSNSSESLIFESKAIMKRRKLIKLPSGRRTPRSRPVMVVRCDTGDGGGSTAYDTSESDSTHSRWDEFASDPEAQCSPLIKPKRVNESECIDRCVSRSTFSKGKTSSLVESVGNTGAEWETS